jgi:transcriptional regulator
MYQPAHERFAVVDPAAALAGLAGTVAATLVSLSGGELRASILPMLYDPDDGPYGTLRGHLARPNPQWRDAPGDVEALAIFDGPSTYISPSLYEAKRLTGEVVPTWNYVTVQARGPLAIHAEADWLRAHVQRLVDRHEARRPDPWSVDDAPPAYIASQLRAIVGIELRITRIEAKRKLSQNRSAADVGGVIAGLAVGSPADHDVADEMRREPPPRR